MTADEMRAAMLRMGIAPDRVEAGIASHFGSRVEQRETGRQRDNVPSEVSTPSPATPTPPAASRKSGQEKDEQRRIVSSAKARGAFVYDLSQSRSTQQTPGLPDLYLVWPDVALWWEVKSEKGVLSQAQARFLEQCARNGTPHGFGPLSAFADWCRQHRKGVA